MEAEQHYSFKKSVTGISLTNKGTDLKLMSGSMVIDEWSYPETGEEVSYGRDPDDPDYLRKFFYLHTSTFIYPKLNK